MLQELDAPAQCLFLRLLQRKRSWFRMAALSYTEVPDVDAAVACLVAAGFACTSDAASPEGKCSAIAPLILKYPLHLGARRLHAHC